MLTRRAWLTACTSGIAGIFAATIAALGSVSCRRSPAQAAVSCPALRGRRIRWIVPNAVGGGYDTESRLLQPALERRLGADIVIDNQAGAGGLTGARAIAAAAPDGLTLGIVGMPGLLAASLVGEEAPDPAEAFTILGRVGRSAVVWASGAAPGLATIDEVISTGQRRPLVFAINEIGSASLVGITVTAALLGVRVAFVSGFSGTRTATLAAASGDVDLVCFNYDTIQPMIASGDLRAVLQIGDAPIADDPHLAGAPLLGGPAGVAARAAGRTGGNVDDAVALASMLARVIGSGRVVVGPRGMDDATARCLSAALEGAIADARAQGLNADPAGGDAAHADVIHAAADARALLPFIKPAAAELRGRPSR